MNSVNIIGRITHTLELKRTQAGKPYCSFQVAVDRRGKGPDGERQSDFIDCTAWARTAEALVNYTGKGRKIGITGRLQTQRWKDKEGKDRKAMNVVVDSFDFADDKRDSRNEGYTYQPDEYYDNGMQYSDTDPYESPYGGFAPVDDDGELPF